MHQPLTFLVCLLTASTMMISTGQVGCGENASKPIAGASQNSASTTGQKLPLRNVKSATRVAKKQNKAKLTEDDALKLIENRSEVKSWKLGVSAPAAKARGVTPHIAIDRKEGSEYVVHVYEEVPDDAETSHTATFNWYHVNERTGKVKTEF